MSHSHPSGDQHWTHRMPDRIPRGAHAPGAKLSDAQIRAIHLLHRSGVDQTIIARAFGVSRITIWRQLRRAGLLE